MWIQIASKKTAELPKCINEFGRWLRGDEKADDSATHSATKIKADWRRVFLSTVLNFIVSALDSGTQDAEQKFSHGEWKQKLWRLRITRNHDSCWI